MRILHIVYSLVPNQYKGGIPKIVFELGKAQHKLGHEVEVYTTNTNSGLPVDVPLMTPVDCEGVQVQYFPITRAIDVHSACLRSNLLRHCAAFDVVHTHNTFLSLNRIATECSKRSAVPLFVHTHGALDPKVLRMGWFKRLKKTVYLRCIEVPNLNRASCIFANTREEELQVRGQGVNTAIAQLANGVGVVEDPPEHELSVWQKAHGVTAKGPIVCYVGRFHPKKGLHLLVQSFCELRREFPQAQLMMCGDRMQFPDYVRRLDQISRDWKCEDGVLWLGVVDEFNKRMALKSSDIFFHVSESEGMALSILEAMASGLPTMVGRGCNMGDAVADGAVLECDSDVVSVTAQMKNLFIDSALRRRIGMKAFEYVKAKHSWEKIAESAITEYDKYRLQG